MYSPGEPHWCTVHSPDPTRHLDLKQLNKKHNDSFGHGTTGKFVNLEICDVSRLRIYISWDFVR